MEHCCDHKEQSECITEVSRAQERDQAEKRTAKYMFSGFILLTTVICSIIVWIFKDNLETMRTDIKEIKVYIASGSVQDAAVRGELETIRYRLQRLEGKP